MRSSNPALSNRTFDTFDAFSDTQSMTVQGTAWKTLIALCLVMLTAGWTWIQFQQAGGVAGGVQSVMPFLFGGMIVGALLSLATIFKPNWAPYTTPVYALAEGFVLGAISAIIQAQFPKQPIVFQACCLTMGTAFVMLIAYQTGLIRVTQKLRSGITIATGAIMLLYAVSMVMRMFGKQVPFIHESGMLGIGFSVFVVGLAAFNLLLDFDMIENMAAQRAPRHMEWYGAFALLMTLVWLYIEILRLLSKLNRRN